MIIMIQSSQSRSGVRSIHRNYRILAFVALVSKQSEIITKIFCIAQQLVLPVKVLSAVDIFVVICENRTVNKRNTADLSTITK